ncbi:MAG: hypothetical protein IT459_10115 [Planctomycetes bacterium]|nr:hypothetical protein [Planctomycetota bacterium]
MPPALDVYALTRRREARTVEAFLERFVDRAACEDRGDEEMMLLPLQHHGTQPIPKFVDYEWQPAETLTNMIATGLVPLRRCFTIYLPVTTPPLVQATVSFTRDGQLILGLSVDDPGASPQRLELAKRLLDELLTVYDGSCGYIAVEDPPPSDEAEFRDMLASASVLHSRASSVRPPDGAQ